MLFFYACFCNSILWVACFLVRVKVVTYAASAAAGSADNCVDNLKAAYVLLSDIGSTDEGRDLLSTELNLCSPLTSPADVRAYLSYLQVRNESGLVYARFFFELSLRWEYS
jgi:hypothetical protein